MPWQSRENRHSSWFHTGHTKFSPATVALLVIHSGHHESSYAACAVTQRPCLIPPSQCVRIKTLDARRAQAVSANTAQHKHNKQSGQVAVHGRAFTRKIVTILLASAVSDNSMNHEPSARTMLRVSQRDSSGAEALPESSQERQKEFMKRMVQFVKEGDASGALQLYDTAEELGFRLTQNVFNAVLSVCATGDWVSQGKRVLSDMQQAGFTPKENSYGFLLREAAGRGSFDEAFSILKDMADTGVTPRLRSYAPVFRGLCSKPDMRLAGEVWSHMRKRGISPLEEDYVYMIKGWAKEHELWHRVRDGSAERLLWELSEAAFELSSSANVEAVRGGTTPAMSFLDTLLGAFNSDMVEGETEGSAPVAFTTEPSPEGVCDCCGGRLRAVGLSDEERSRVRCALRELAKESMVNGPLRRIDAVGEREERKARGRRGGSDIAVRAPSGDLEHFAGWLDEKRRQQGPDNFFTTVVDGCNVAYYGQNVEGGRFRMLQIDRLVKMLEAEGERVLIILPQRYLRPVVINSSRFKGSKNSPTRLSTKALALVEEWEEKGMLYKCVDGAEDDIFWMYFTVALDTSGPTQDTSSHDSDDENGEREESVMTNGSDAAVHQGGGYSASEDPETYSQRNDCGEDLTSSSVSDRSAPQSHDLTSSSVSDRPGTQSYVRQDKAHVPGGKEQVKAISTVGYRAVGSTFGDADQSRVEVAVRNDPTVNDEVVDGRENVRFDRRKVCREQGEEAEGAKAGGIAMGNAAAGAKASAARLTVITNDEMRNHRMALLEPVPFKRWRNAQVRAFHLPFTSPNSCKEEDGTDSDSDTKYDCSKSVDGRDLMENDEVKADDGGNDGRGEQTPTLEVVCGAPAFTRDMQVVDRAWHIPVRNPDSEPGGKWLCINLKAGLAGDDARNAIPEDKR